MPKEKLLDIKRRGQGHTAEQVRAQRNTAKHQASFSQALLEIKLNAQTHTLPDLKLHRWFQAANHPSSFGQSKCHNILTVKKNKKKNERVDPQV